MPLNTCLAPHACVATIMNLTSQLWLCVSFSFHKFFWFIMFQWFCKRRIYILIWWKKNEATVYLLRIIILNTYLYYVRKIHYLNHGQLLVYIITSYMDASRVCMFVCGRLSLHFYLTMPSPGEEQLQTVYILITSAFKSQLFRTNRLCIYKYWSSVLLVNIGDIPCR